MAIAVFLSTLTTKQHVIIDVIGGVVLAELSCFIARWIFKKMMGNAK
jgi:membrane-associated phospholipid phosphatase